MHSLIHSFCGKVKKVHTVQWLRNVSQAITLADSVSDSYSYANFSAALTAFPATFIGNSACSPLSKLPAGPSGP
jgi:hypothetical protein